MIPMPYGEYQVLVPSKLCLNDGTNKICIEMLESDPEKYLSFCINLGLARAFKEHEEII